MTFLAPFIAPILAGIRWLGAVVAPGLMTAFAAHLLAKLAIGIVSGAVILTAATTLLGIAQAQVSALGGVSASALDLLRLFGVFEALSLIMSAYLAKATWLMVKPTLTLVNPPSP